MKWNCQGSKFNLILWIGNVYTKKWKKGRNFMKEKVKRSKIGWYLLSLSIGAILGIAVFNKIGWIF